MRQGAAAIAVGEQVADAVVAAVPQVQGDVLGQWPDAVALGGTLGEQGDGVGLVGVEPGEHLDVERVVGHDGHR